MATAVIAAASNFTPQRYAAIDGHRKLVYAAMPMLLVAISSVPLNRNCQTKIHASMCPQRARPKHSRRKMYEPPEAGMAEPNSANTRPSAIASMAPTAHANNDCGPPMVARIAGTVMKGPVPTMFDMLIETAFSNPNLRGSRACGSPAYAGLVPVLSVTREPFLREVRARILQITVDDQQTLARFSGRH